MSMSVDCPSGWPAGGSLMLVREMIKVPWFTSLKHIDHPESS